MKVLHIIDSGGLYGAEVMLLNLVSEQIKLGLDPTICSIGEKNIPEKPLETEAIARGFKIRKIRMRAGPNIIGALKILKFAKDENFDLMHSHGYKANILFGFMPKKIRKIPMVTTLHGWTNTGQNSRMKLYEWLDAKSLKYIDAVILVSKAMLSNSKLRNLKIKNLTVINNGISISKNNKHNLISTNNLDADIINFCKGGIIIGSIGRLSAEKGFEYLIDAVPILLKQNVNIKLIIIGEGHEKIRLQKKIDTLNISNKVLLAGYKREAYRYLDCFDIFVIPSLTEGLPISILEAMQAKIPIVASRVGGIPEVLQNGKGGLLVEPKNPTSLAHAILQIIDNPDLSQKFTNFSYKEAVSKYTGEDMALKYINLYGKLIYGGRL